MTMSDKIDAAALTRWILESARIIMANQEALSELDASTGDAPEAAPVRARAAEASASAADPISRRASTPSSRCATRSRSE